MPKKELKPHKGTNSYLYVNLYEKGRNRLSIHYLVLLTYKRDRIGKEVINHIDGIKTNNNLNNLEYCTHIENMQHASRLGLMKGSGPKRNKRISFGLK